MAEIEMNGGRVVAAWARMNGETVDLVAGEELAPEMREGLLSDLDVERIRKEEGGAGEVHREGDKIFPMAMASLLHDGPPIHYNLQQTIDLGRFLDPEIPVDQDSLVNSCLGGFHLATQSATRRAADDLTRSLSGGTLRLEDLPHLDEVVVMEMAEALVSVMMSQEVKVDRNYATYRFRFPEWMLRGDPRRDVSKSDTEAAR